MQQKHLVPTLNFERHNEHFDFERSPFYVNTGLTPWKTEAGTARRAAVSSFGFSGTNAHLVLEEYEEAAGDTAPEPLHAPASSSCRRGARSSSGRPPPASATTSGRTRRWTRRTSRTRSSWAARP